jgi:hypothetical protein
MEVKKPQLAQNCSVPLEAELAISSLRRAGRLLPCAHQRRSERAKLPLLPQSRLVARQSPRRKGSLAISHERADDRFSDDIRCGREAVCRGCSRSQYSVLRALGASVCQIVRDATPSRAIFTFHCVLESDRTFRWAVHFRRRDSQSNVFQFAKA